MFAPFQQGRDTWADPRLPRPRVPSDAAQVPPDERTWLLTLRPNPGKVDALLESWWRRWTVLLLFPCVIIWVWVAIPFPLHQDNNPATDVLDVDFYFYLFWFFGGYLAAALLFITSLFGLYRLNWWPQRLGGHASYFCFWAGALLIGLCLHHWDIFGTRNRWRQRQPTDGQDAVGSDWERKTIWTTLAACTMAAPAWVCFAKLRADRRQTYRPMTEMQRTFLERQLTGRIPRSYKRFLWFMGCLLISLATLTAGQGFASIYLATLPHNSIDGVVYVWTWIAAVQILSMATMWILEVKVRSRALLFVFRYYFHLAYFIFYRTLFARLRSQDQFMLIQTLNSIWVVVAHPVAFSRAVHWVLRHVVAYEKEYEEHCESLAQSLWLRQLAENCTIACFLGYLTILHFGPNVAVFPFFSLDHPTPHDPYNYRLTFSATLIIWATEISSAFVARHLIRWLHKVDITQEGLEELRAYPDLLPALVLSTVHVISDILLFLIRLNFK